MTEPLIGLVMVGKNESATVGRALESVRPLIDTYTFCDTGSEDDTVAVVKDTLGNIPGRVYRHKWVNFGHNLTLAHRRARGTARWLLWLHCDMTVETDARAFRAWLGRRRKKMPDAGLVAVHDHGLVYPLPLLMKGDLAWQYVGPTHEYLALAGRTVAHLTGIYVSHHSDGGMRADKLERDIELLRPGFEKGDPRAIFYTAQSYRYLGHDEHAAAIYDLRAQMNGTADSPVKMKTPGWEEERWYSAMQAAALRRDLEGLIEVWRERPWRHEPLLAAARIVSAAFPEGGGDLLFREPLPAGRPTL